MKSKDQIGLLTRASDKILEASVLLQKAGARREVAQCDLMIKHIANYRDRFERIEDE